MSAALPVHPRTALEAVARVEQVAEQYGSGDDTVHALRGVDLAVRRGPWPLIAVVVGGGVVLPGIASVATRVARVEALGVE
jgi:hypothetical protein